VEKGARALSVWSAKGEREGGAAHHAASTSRAGELAALKWRRDGGAL
jgi:hypothetical protein